jgi:hypothetical protein
VGLWSSCIDYGAERSDVVAKEGEGGVMMVAERGLASNFIKRRGQKWGSEKERKSVPVRKC